jgi:hypothetical protein
LIVGWIKIEAIYTWIAKARDNLYSPFKMEENLMNRIG